MIIQTFLSALFDDGDYTCFADSAKGWQVYPVSSAAIREEHQFFCINALDGAVDRRPVKDWHSRLIPRRADANVTKYRTFLIESDTLPVDRQIDYYEKLGLPYTAAVFSGSKSIHFLIVLTDPVSKGKYDDLAKRLQNAVGFADSSSTNASRLSRLPFQIRQSTGLPQSLMKLQDRVTIEQLETFIDWMSPAQLETSVYDVVGSCSPRVRRRLKFLSEANQTFLQTGKMLRHTSRHSALVSLAGGLKFLEFDQDTIIEKLTEAAQKCNMYDDPTRNVDEEIKNITQWVLSNG